MWYYGSSYFEWRSYRWHFIHTRQINAFTCGKHAGKMLLLQRHTVPTVEHEVNCVVHTRAFLNTSLLNYLFYCHHGIHCLWPLLALWWFTNLPFKRNVNQRHIQYNTHKQFCKANLYKAQYSVFSTLYTQTELCKANLYISITFILQKSFWECTQNALCIYLNHQWPCLSYSVRYLCCNCAPLWQWKSSTLGMLFQLVPNHLPSCTPTKLSSALCVLSNYSQAQNQGLFGFWFTFTTRPILPWLKCFLTVIPLIYFTSNHLWHIWCFKWVQFLVSLVVVWWRDVLRTVLSGYAF